MIDNLKHRTKYNSSVVDREKRLAQTDCGSRESRESARRPKLDPQLSIARRRHSLHSSSLIHFVGRYIELGLRLIALRYVRNVNDSCARGDDGTGINVRASTPMFRVETPVGRNQFSIISRARLIKNGSVSIQEGKIEKSYSRLYSVLQILSASGVIY